MIYCKSTHRQHKHSLELSEWERLLVTLRRILRSAGDILYGCLLDNPQNWDCWPPGVRLSGEIEDGILPKTSPEFQRAIPNEQGVELGVLPKR